MSKLRRILNSRGSNVTVEFAIVGPVFLFLLLFVFEIAFDLFCQEDLDVAVAVASRQIQIGTPQTANATPASFITNYLCPAGFNLINCNNLYVRVEVVNLDNTSSCKDLYTATTGTLPITGSTLNLASFTSVNGPGSGAAVATTSCDNGSYTGYCNPDVASTYVILTAVYVAPSFMNGFVPSSRLYTYNGADVRAQIAASAFETDSFKTLSASTACS